MEIIYRNPIAQNFDHFALTVPSANRVPVSQVAQSLDVYQYESMIFSVPIASPDPVYFGGPTVHAGAAGLGSNGLQIRPGIPVMLSINSTRQLVELQAPLVDTLPALGGMACSSPLIIPRIVWDVANLYLIAEDAPVVVGVLLFRAML